MSRLFPTFWGGFYTTIAFVVVNALLQVRVKFVKEEK
jgi:hypothetical protein